MALQPVRITHADAAWNVHSRDIHVLDDGMYAVAVQRGDTLHLSLCPRVGAGYLEGGRGVPP